MRWREKYTKQLFARKGENKGKVVHGEEGERLRAFVNL